MVRDKENTVKLLKHPDPILSQRAEEVDPHHPDLRVVVNNMMSIMRDNDGVGIAAPQVGKSWRVFIAMGEVWINPKITVLDGGYESRREGCLSIPNVSVMVRRAKRVKITGFNLERITKEITSPEVARVLQHENDHLDGVLINKTPKKRSFKKRRK